jgi:DNA mismatch repair protein MutS2
MSNNNPDASFSESLVESLDLIPLLQKVAAHCGTRRGRQALLSLVDQDDDSYSSKQSFRTTLQLQLVSSKKRRVVMEQSKSKRAAGTGTPFRVFPCTSASQARAEYDLIDQATLALQGMGGHNTNSNTLTNTTLTFPPLYSADSNPWDTHTIPTTDDDDWLSLPIEEWTLEHILQAELVTKMLTNVLDWAEQDEIQTWMPLLSDIGRRMDREVLEAVQEEISGAVQVARVMVRSLSDPAGRSTYQFQLAQDKFRILEVLRQREHDLQERVGNAKASAKSHLVRDLTALTEELEAKEAEILFGLARTIYGSLRVIDTSLNVVAQLDTIFARAAFGEQRNGRRPMVGREGRIDVKQFVHPLLGPTESNGSSSSSKATPVDLHLSTEESERALIISGPNGGGKTLAMKSFGVVCVLCKLGIPIPTTTDITTGTSTQLGPLRADFFDEILVSVGDRQNVEQGQSTFTAQLNAYSSLIQTVCLESARTSTTLPSRTHLILIDELGGGTEANAGGAIAQAVLEKLLGTGVCHIVVTTHSARLKALSFDSDEFSCATVLLRKDNDGSGSEKYRLPSFELQYGVIGESHALGAASRCTPQLPDDVLARASDLMATLNEETGDASSGDYEYLRTLTRSLEKQVGIAESARIQAEMSASNTAKCQRAMISLASAYDRHLALLEERIERCFQEMKDTKTSTDLLGETLSELRVVKRQVQSEQDLLRERGLKMLPASYDLADGESIFIVKQGEWDGVTGKVVTLDPLLGRQLTPDEVAVLPSLTMWEEMMPEDPMDARPGPMVFKRYELAIWDFDSVWDESEDDMPKFTSIKDTKRRLNDVLSTLKTGPTSSQPRTTESSVAQSTFSSSRQRKAAKQKQAKQKRNK